MSRQNVELPRVAPQSSESRTRSREGAHPASRPALPALGPSSPPYRPAGKLQGQVALIAGAHDAISQAVAIVYAQEGADVAIGCLPRDQDAAQATRDRVLQEGRRCILVAGDLGESAHCIHLVERTVAALGKLDVVVSHGGARPGWSPAASEDADSAAKGQLYGYLRLLGAALPHMQAGGVILVTSPDAGATTTGMQAPQRREAINAFTRALSRRLIKRGIRINAIAPGPALAGHPADGASAFDASAWADDSSQNMRPATPEEIAPAYVFLASAADAACITGIVLPLSSGISTRG